MNVTCYVCNEAQPSVEHLLLHIRMVHQWSPGTNLVCCYCCSSFGLLNSYSKHLKNCSLQHEQSLPTTSSEENRQIENRERNVCRYCDRVECLGCQTASEQASVEDMDCDNVEHEIVDKEFHSYPFRSDVDKFVTSLYAVPNLPRNLVQKVISATEHLLSSKFLETLHCKVLENCKDSPHVLEISNMLTQLKNPFEHLRTEYLRFKYFQSKNTLLMPKPVIIGQKNVRKKVKDKLLSVNVDRTIILNPLELMLQKFFSLPNVLKHTFDYMEYVDSMTESGMYFNVINGEMWQEKKTKFIPGRKYVPGYCFFDEYQVNKGLGAHRNSKKIGACYLVLPSLPPYMRSKLENIFMIALFLEEHRKEMGNSKTFTPIINVLNSLYENGITVEVDGEVHQIHLVICAVIGDNLGVHQILGFVPSFSANFSCRICKIHKKDLLFCNCEDETLLRTRQSYDDDVLLNNVTMTGIVEESCYNTVTDYHVTDNISVDPMHDMDEGNSKRILAYVINDIVIVRKLDTLESINFQLQCFNYELSGISNKPPYLVADHIKNGTLSLSASETLFLTRNLPFFIGDKVPEGDKTWSLFLCLRALMHWITAPNCHKCDADAIGLLAEELNELYKEVTGHSGAMKMHFILHYKRVFLSLGPIIHLSCRRPEGKHREGKQVADSTTSRTNAPLTIAIKNQLKFCDRLESEDSGIPNQYDCVFIRDLDESDHRCVMLKSVYPDVTGSLKETKSLFVYSRKISTDMPIIVKFVDGEPEFGFVTTILSNGQQFYIQFQCTENIGFNEHFHSYEVVKLQQLSFVSVETVPVFVKPSFKVMPCGTLFVSLPHRI